MQMPQLWTVFQLYVVLMKTMRTFDQVVGGDRTERINRHEPAQNVFIP